MQRVDLVQTKDGGFRWTQKLETKHLPKIERKEKKRYSPEIPMSYPKMRPPDAATMQVITTDAVTLPLKALELSSTAKPPTAILSPLLPSFTLSQSKRDLLLSSE